MLGSSGDKARPEYIFMFSFQLFWCVSIRLSFYRCFVFDLFKEVKLLPHFHIIYWLFCWKKNWMNFWFHFDSRGGLLYYIFKFSFGCHTFELTCDFLYNHKKNDYFMTWKILKLSSHIIEAAKETILSESSICQT